MAIKGEERDAVRISSFGQKIAPGETIGRILSVLSSLAEQHSLHYHLAGESHDWPALRRIIAAHGMSAHVTITENATPEELQQQIEATDIALCLNEPGEAISYLHQMMRAGLPIIAFATDAVTTLPDDSLVKVERDEYAEALLAAYLERLIADAGLRKRIGANARRYIERTGESSGPEKTAGPVARNIQTHNGRFPKLEGIDYKRGAVFYPDRLDASNRHHLLTKPFYNLAHKISRWEGEGLDEDTHRHFCDFANIAQVLALPAASRILDVGCGSGWLTEYFARLGYDVTGIDISPELIRLAQERLSRVPYGADHETPLSYRFLVHDVEAAPLAESFDAIICYDALHHFEDEGAVLSHLFTMLGDGGLLFVLEGELPPEGSQTEAELRSVMREYETLESPFSREYLRSLLLEHGFSIVGDYVSVSGLFERELINGDSQLPFEPAAVNYLLCKKTGGPAGASIPDSREPNRLCAQFTPLNEWTERVAPGSQLQLSLEVENCGDTLWLASRLALKGAVRVGVKIFDEEGAIVDEAHGAPPLTRALAPGERARLKLNLRAPLKPGAYLLKLDLLVQDICWFEQHGSKPLSLPFEVESV